MGTSFFCVALFALGENQRGEKALRCGGAFRVDELDGTFYSAVYATCCSGLNRFFK
jgi:hypothetical protein